jgi:hypothetical protein
MGTQISPENPRAAHRRKTIAARRIGEGNHCACGEDRPEALIAGSNPLVCAECDRRREYRTTRDDHHIAGAANNPITIAIRVNDHRAVLSTAQYSWPPKTLQNPDGSPLLSAGAHIRGYADVMLYLMKEFLLWIARMLELLDTILEQKMGRKWWRSTKLKSFEPRP